MVLELIYTKTMDKDSISYGLGEYDIRYFLPEMKIITHEEMLQCKSIKDIFHTSPYNTVILHYAPDGENHGHWVALKRLKGKIHYYDSYGQRVDAPHLIFKNKIRDHLAKLLARRVYGSVLYNDEQMQEFKEGVNTCGRYAVLFADKQNMDIDRFNDYIKNQMKLYGFSNPDEYIAAKVSFTENV